MLQAKTVIQKRRESNKLKRQVFDRGIFRITIAFGTESLAACFLSASGRSSAR